MIPVMVTRFTLTLKEAIAMDSNEDEETSAVSFTARPSSLYTDGGDSSLYFTDLESTRARVGLPLMFPDVGHRLAQDSV